MNPTAIAFVEWSINLARAYLIAGFIFALLFVVFWVQRVDPAARGRAIGFRILIIPGVTALWPLFATRLLRGKRHPTEQNAHRVLTRRAQSTLGG
ncbi:MAG: hypothetical protein AAFX78_14800 [Cyanobacteria bacterium J06638_20]